MIGIDGEFDSPDTRRLVRTIRSGSLAFKIDAGAQQFDHLLNFASRRNSRRGYLHVSRVLGKHLPVRPSVIDASHQALAAKIQPVGNNIYVIGMAETATGLGAGVARHLCRMGSEVTYQHTTRFNTGTPLVSIKEAHSHAADMVLAQPDKRARYVLDHATDIVLVDDEISTGATMLDFVSKLVAPELGLPVMRIHIVSLVSWLDDDAFDALRAVMPSTVHLQTASLMHGSFIFTANKDFTAELPARVDSGFSAIPDDMSPALYRGIYGARMTRKQIAHDEAFGYGASGSPISVIGMGEFLDAPFLTALSLEQIGLDVVFQSSTRSPIALGDCIGSMIRFPASNNTDKEHYLYNPAAGRAPLAFDGMGGAAASGLVNAFLGPAITNLSTLESEVV